MALYKRLLINWILNVDKMPKDSIILLYAAILMGRTTGLARPSVPYGLLSPNSKTKRCRKTKWVWTFARVGVKGVTIFSLKGQRSGGHWADVHVASSNRELQQNVHSLSRPQKSHRTVSKFQWLSTADAVSLCTVWSNYMQHSSVNFSYITSHFSC